MQSKPWIRSRQQYNLFERVTHSPLHDNSYRDKLSNHPKKNNFTKPPIEIIYAHLTGKAGFTIDARNLCHQQRKTNWKEQILYHIP